MDLTHFRMGWRARAGAQAVGRACGTVAAAAVLALVATPVAQSQQQPAPPQQPRQQPAQPQQPQPQRQQRPAQPRQPQPQPPAQSQPAQPQQQQQAQQLQLVYSPWTKLCNKDNPGGKQLCVTVKDGRAESGQLMISVALVEMEGEQRKLFRVSMPYGVALQHGSRMIIDQAPPASSQFVTCLPPGLPPGGCITDYDATADTIQRLKKGQWLTVQAIHMNGEPISPQLTLSDFAKAYDGPPTDQKVYEEQQKKMQEEFQRRQQQQQQPQQPPPQQQR